jgi:hypothetical protein
MQLSMPAQVFLKPSAIVMIAGSILFLIAAFSPISRIFGEPDAMRRLEMIMNARTQWTVAQFFFVAGALVMPISIGMFGHQFSGTPLAAYLYGIMGLLLIGALFWSWHVYLRTVDPALFTSGALPAWLFVTYTLLTMVGLALFGWVLLQTGLPPWTGWMMIGSMVALLVLAAAFGDMPPFVYYVFTLIVGIVMLRSDGAV